MNAEAKPEGELFPLLDEYWQTLQGGADDTPEQWLRQRPVGKGGLSALRVLAALRDAQRMVDEDSCVDSANAGTKPSERPGPRDLLEPGTRLGECRIERLLGAGGMGEVYLAEHEVLGRQVAIKVLPRRLADDVDAVPRFRKSVQLLARLNPHPHVAAALHASEHEGRLYLVMEYVPGDDLKSVVLRSGPLPVDKACAVIRQAAEGLHYAHREGLVHRDVKPANLMLAPEGTVKVLDLGLARLLPTTAQTPEPSLTGAWVMLGTADYMAPEQARDARSADARSDLYSLGCTFYFLLTGQAPFGGDSHLAKAMAHAQESPCDIRQRRPDVPPAVAAVLHKLLAKKPEDRYPSARALVEALDAATSLRTTSPAERLPRARSWGLVAAGLAAVAVGAGLVTYFATRPIGSNPDSATAPPPPAVTREPLALENLTMELWQGLQSKTPDDYVHSGNVALISNRQDQKLELPAVWRFAPVNEGLRLRGRFNRPTLWYLLWIDTNGAVTVKAPPGETAELEYPSKNIARPGKEDPLGVHLILMAAGSLPPEVGVERLQQQLRGIGKPPPISWAGTLRGPDEVAAPEEASRAYLKAVYARMPEEVQPVYALFIRTSE